MSLGCPFFLSSQARTKISVASLSSLYGTAQDLQAEVRNRHDRESICACAAYQKIHAQNLVPWRKGSSTNSRQQLYHRVTVEFSTDGGLTYYFHDLPSSRLISTL